MNTLGRTGSGQAQNDIDHTNSLEKRTYLPSYVGKFCAIRFTCFSRKENFLGKVRSCFPHSGNLRVFWFCIAMLIP